MKPDRLVGGVLLILVMLLAVFSLHLVQLHTHPLTVERLRVPDITRSSAP